MESVFAEEGTQEMDILARKVNEVLPTRARFLERELELELEFLNC